MPIRMTDDPVDPNEQQQNDGGDGPQFPGGGGGGGLLSFLPLILGLVRGRGGIFILLLLAGGYFLLRKTACSPAAAVQKIFSQSGYNFDPAQFSKASVYEGLANDSGRNPLPESVSLLKYAPVPGDQGQQGSCVAWSTAYGARTILEAASSGADPNDIRFSPSFLYNQIGMNGCDGSYIQRAMEFMNQKGAIPLKEFSYSDQDCSRLPNSSQMQEAQQYRIHGFTRLTESEDVNGINVRAVKEHLAKNAPVCIGMMVGGSFMNDMMGQEVWHPEGMDRSQMGFGGHAMCVIGYDDNKEGGSFQILNSWGANWGHNGVAWVHYNDFRQYVREAYGMDPLPKRGPMANVPLECNIGLIINNNKQYIPFRISNGNEFETSSPIRKGTSFKIELKNTSECYIYLFGMDSDGSSYTLFPYLRPGETVSRFSPYCGITGYRWIPNERRQSLTADSIGNRDYMAVVVSRDSLDYNQLNQAVTQSSQTGYAAKINEALQQILIRSVRYSNGPNGTIYFKADANDNKAVACILAIDKN